MAHNHSPETLAAAMSECARDLEATLLAGVGPSDGRDDDSPCQSLQTQQQQSPSSPYRGSQHQRQQQQQQPQPQPQAHQAHHRDPAVERSRHSPLVTEPIGVGLAEMAFQPRSSHRHGHRTARDLLLDPGLPQTPLQLPGASNSNKPHFSSHHNTRLSSRASDSSSPPSTPLTVIDRSNVLAHLSEGAYMGHQPMHRTAAQMLLDPGLPRTPGLGPSRPGGGGGAAPLPAGHGAAAHAASSHEAVPSIVLVHEPRRSAAAQQPQPQPQHQLRSPPHGGGNPGGLRVVTHPASHKRELSAFAISPHATMINVALTEGGNMGHRHVRRSAHDLLLDPGLPQTPLQLPGASNSNKPHFSSHHNTRLSSRASDSSSPPSTPLTVIDRSNVLAHLSEGAYMGHQPMHRTAAQMLLDPGLPRTPGLGPSRPGGGGGGGGGAAPLPAGHGAAAHAASSHEAVPPIVLVPEPRRGAAQLQHQHRVPQLCVSNPGGLHVATHPAGHKRELSAFAISPHSTLINATLTEGGNMGTLHVHRTAAQMLLDPGLPCSPGVNDGDDDAPPAPTVPHARATNHATARGATGTARPHAAQPAARPQNRSGAGTIGGSASHPSAAAAVAAAAVAAATTAVRPPPPNRPPVLAHLSEGANMGHQPVHRTAAQMLLDPGLPASPALEPAARRN